MTGWFRDVAVTFLVTFLVVIALGEIYAHLI